MTQVSQVGSACAKKAEVLILRETGIQRYVNRMYMLHVYACTYTYMHMYMEMKYNIQK